MGVEVQVRASFVISLPALTILVHIRPNIRMVNSLRVGRVFIAGGQIFGLFRFIGDHLMWLVQMRLIATLQREARYDISFAYGSI